MDRKKIMLVDDDEDFLDITSQRIKMWEYEVLTATNGVDAIELFKKSKPDAIILDYLMPNINGVQLLAKIRAIDSKVPAIIFTSCPESNGIEKAKRIGIVAFVPKLSPYADAQENLKVALDIAFKEK